MIRSKAIVFTAPRRPLVCRDATVPEPGLDQFVVRVTHAGICGSDVHRLIGDLGMPAGPVCFGHEGVGVIESVGANVTMDRVGNPVAKGDRIYWVPGGSCGQCRFCRGEKTLGFCQNRVWPAPFGEPNAAAFQEFATLNLTTSFCRIPDGVTSDSVIAFGCAMPTALTALQRLGDISGTNVVVQGSGPVGLAMCLVARLNGAAQVAVIGDPVWRLDIARRFGADAIFSLSDTTREERRARIIEMTGGAGADVVVEAAGRVEAFDEGLHLLAHYGRYAIVGLYSGSATTSFNPVYVNNRNIRIIGSMYLDMREIAGAVDVATQAGAKYGFGDLITHRFSLEQTEDAINCAGRGESIKAIVVPSGE